MRSPDLSAFGFLRRLRQRQVIHFMPFRIKEIFYTLQGEGMNAGRPAVFCRFAGCNLWSGREEDRASAVCKFCDTDFVGGAWYPDAARLALAIRDKWPGSGRAFTVLTGGEPTLQATEALILELHALQIEVAMETNGTRPAPAVDWLTVSPKANSFVVQKTGDELKVVWPQPLDLCELGQWGFKHFLLQPMAGRVGSLEETVAKCRENPRWRLSLQYHKYINLP